MTPLIVFGIIVLAILILGLAYSRLYVTLARITISDGHLELTSPFRRRRVPMGTVHRVLRRTIVGSALAQSRTYLFLDDRDRRLMQLPADYWDEVRLQALWQRLGLTPDGSWEDRITYSEAKTQSAP